MKRKNIIFALLITLIVFLGGTSIANALINAPKNLTINSYRKSVGDNPLNINDGFTVKKTSDGRYVYCIDYVKLRSQGLTYTKGNLSKDNGLSYIVNQGINNSNETDYFITQAAVWLYLEDTNGMTVDNSGAMKKLRDAVYSSSNNNNSVATKIRDLVSNAKKAKASGDPYIKISNKNITFTLSSDGKYYVSNTINVDTNLDKYELSFENAPKGLEYTNKDNKITLSIPVDNVNGVNANFKIKVSGSKTVYETYIYNPSDNRYQPVAVPYKATINVEDSATAKHTVGPTTITISKQDITTKKELPGATLVVKNSDGEVVETWVSTDKPHIIYGLPVGTYTLTEEKAPEGYVLSTETITFEVTENGIEKTVVMYNDVEPIEEVPVEPTSSFAPMALSFVGILVIALGSVFIFKNIKQDER